MLKIILFLLFFLTGSMAHAVKDFNIKNNSQSYFFVNGTTGNVGIGSVVPGKTLDVQGTVRTAYFQVTGPSAATGYVLTAISNEGNTTWSLPQDVSGWTITNTNDVYQANGGNIGIGTTLTSTSALTVMNGNVGIGTWVPAAQFHVGPFSSSSGFMIDANGNVGLGTTRTTAGAMTVISGNMGIGTWIPTQQLRVKTNAIITSLAVGPGNTAVLDGQLHHRNATGAGSSMFFNDQSTGTTTNDGLEVGINTRQDGLIQYKENTTNIYFSTQDTERMRLTAGGNLGIGTVVAFNVVDIAGNVGVGTGINSSFVTTTAPNGGMIIESNVGIASLRPGHLLDVQGTARVIGFAMSGQSPLSGYVLTSSSSTGDATWMASSNISGWTVSGSDVYKTSGGSVGIGTSMVTTTALTVMNGNVGIGTWIPTSSFVVIGSWEDAFTTVSLDTALDHTHRLVDVDCTGGPVTITLPTAVGIDGRCYKIKDWKGQAAVNNITVATTAAQTIDSNANVILTLNYQSYDFCSDGANWLIF